MKHTSIYRQKKKKNTTVIILIIVAVLFFIAGVVLLLIDPIRSSRRMKITNDALESIEARISENSVNGTDESTPITIVVSKHGNEVAGEQYDYYADDDALADLQNEVAEMEANLPDDITLTCVGILKIDKIDLSLPVWDSVTRVSLRYGLGLYEDSARPGTNGNSTIFGHRNQHTSTMFYRLKEVEPGDTVRLVLVSGEELKYRVREVKFVSPDHIVENIVSSASSSPRLTLITCATERGEGHRRLVICDPI